MLSPFIVAFSIESLAKIIMMHPDPKEGNKTKKKAPMQVQQGGIKK